MSDKYHIHFTEQETCVKLSEAYYGYCMMMHRFETMGLGIFMFLLNSKSHLYSPSDKKRYRDINKQEKWFILSNVKIIKRI